MILQALTFYLFASICLASGVMVISARNPVHAVLYLVLVFFNAAGLFVLMGAEFLAMLLVIVYVGAVAVLFLFVVMMLDVNFAELRQGFLQYLPIGGLIGFILLVELLLALASWVVSPDAGSAMVASAAAVGGSTNAHALGRLIYTHYAFLFQISGLILLIAMIGAIVLTLRRRPDVKRQKIDRQIARRRDEAVAVVKVEVGKGI